MVISRSHRAEFVKSSIHLLENYGLDGLDIDYEYPRNADEARGYLSLLKELRAGLDAHARRKGINYHYPLTVSVHSFVS